MAAPDNSDDIFHPGGQVRLDILQEPTHDALRLGLHYARLTQWDSVRSPHVFMGLLAAPDKGVTVWGQRLGADLPRLLEQFRELFHQEHGDADALLCMHREFLSDNVIRLLRDSYLRAADHGRDAVSPMDILVTLFTTPNGIVAECFERVGVSPVRLAELALLAEQHATRTV